MKRLSAALALAMCAPAFADTAELILPVVVNGYVRQPLHYQTTFRIVNLSAAPAEVTLEAFTNEGTAVRILELFPVARTGTTTTFKLEPLGSVEAFTYEDVPSFNGWARLTFDASALIEATAEVALIDAPPGPHPICRRPSTEIVTSVSFPAVRAAAKFAGFAVRRPNRQGAYAIVNPSATRATTAYLSLMDFAGKLVATSTVELAPQARSSKFLSDLFPDAPADFMGSLRITGSAPLASAAVNVVFPDGEFVAVQLGATAAGPCIQVITPARNPLTGECRTFSTPCEVPDGWEKVSACK
jgi:hypothetical protein